MGRSNDYSRRARRHITGRIRLGPVVKCRMCESTWLYGRNRMRGTCDKCAKIALHRNNWQVLAHGRPHVVSAGWSVGEWPGMLKVKFKLEDGTFADVTISYEQASAYKGNIAAWVDAELERVQNEHTAKDRVDQGD